MAFLVENNMPSAGNIRWSSLNIQYKGVNYEITNGYTNYSYTYWTPASPNTLVVSNAFPTLGVNDCLLFLNKTGIAIVVPTSNVITGDIISPGTILAANLAANTITGDKIAANTIATTNLAAGCITTDLLAANAIGAENIAANVITGDRLIAESITAREIATQTITANHLAVNAVTANVIAANAIGAISIAAGAVTADKINALGLKISNNDIDTFVVQSDGQVSMAGTVSSLNYNSNTKAGWKISNDGNADFYNATLRGDLLLPNSGMTNMYDHTAIYGRNLVLNSLVNLSGTTYQVYEATMSRDIVAGTVYTCVIDATIQPTQTIGLWQNAGTAMKGTFIQIGTTNRWYLTFTAITPTGGNERKVRLYNPPSSSSAWTLGFIYLYEGDDIINDWVPAPEDNINPVRMWSGADFVSRETAPFRVYQDGSIVANQGTFNGTLSGRVDIGNIHIIDTNATSASFKINSNNDASTLIQFEESTSYVNTEFIIGDTENKHFYINPNSDIAYFKHVSLNVEPPTGNNNVVFPNKSTGDLMQFVGNSHAIEKNATTNALTFKTNISSAFEDFTFERSGVAGDVSVLVDGDLKIASKIIISNLSIQKKTDGIDFIFN
jgi:hypothetical protein